MSPSRQACRALFLASLLLPLAAEALRADGMLMMEPLPSRGGAVAGWDLFHESFQQAHISAKDGIEILVVRIGLEKANARGVAWLIPVPAQPAALQVEVETEFPRTAGYEVASLAREQMARALDEARAMQLQRLWPDAAQLLGALFFGWHMMSLGELSLDEGGSASLGGGGSRSEAVPDVVVYKHVEREGMVSEVLTARTAAGLYGYLEGKGLRVSKAALPVLDRYVGKDHSFVASWLKPAPGARPERSLKVSFPAQRLYFPLVPTSVYGDRPIPISVRVEGFVTPALPEGLRDLAKVDYCRDRYSSDARRYTKVELQAPARLLTEDLWFDPGSPPRARYYDFLTRSGWLWAVLAGAASMLASLLAGWIVFREWRGRRGALAMAAVGLCNLGGLAALGLAVYLLPTTEPEAGEDARTRELRAQGQRWKAFQHSWKCRTWDPRKLVFLPLFSILFLMLLSGLHALLGAW